METGSRAFVVCGPPDSGKTTWVAQHAQPFDLVWDYDAVANVVLARDRDLRHETLPPFALSLLCELRGVLISFASSGWLPADVGVFVIVTKRESAERIAGVLNAELVVLGS